MKTVTVNLPGSGKWQNVQIAPGTTPKDVLQQLGLAQGYNLAPWKSPNAFATDENLYQAVEDGAKLQAVSPSEVAQARRR